MTQLGPFALIWCIAGPWLLGLALLRSIGLRWRDDRIAFVAWAWMAGGLATGLLVLTSLMLRLPHAVVPWIPLGVALLVTALSRTARRREPKSAGSDEPHPLYHVGVSLIFAVLLIHVFAAGASPITTNDEGDIWSMRAKMMFTSEGFGEDWKFITAPERFPVDIAHDYPELNPLLQYWVYANGGSILHFENRLPIQAFALSMFLVLASLLGRRLRPWLALAALLLVVSTRNFWTLSSLAYGDLMMSAGVLTALQGWLRFREGDSKDVRLAAIGCLGLAVSGWSKNEGLLLLLATMGCLLLATLSKKGALSRVFRSRPRAWIWFALPLFFVTLGRTFNAWFGYRNTLLSPPDADGSPISRALTNFPERIGSYLEWLGKDLFGRPLIDHGVFVAFAAALLIFPHRFVRRERALPVFVALLFMSGVTAVFFAGTREFEWYLNTSGRRVYSQLLPVMVVLLSGFMTETAPFLGRSKPGNSRDH